jgi:predicted DNA-binding protein (MmcQ/YjbR family)
VSPAKKAKAKKPAAKPRPRKPRGASDVFLRHALSYPGAWEDHPWGETVVKVGKKVFVFLGCGQDDAFGVTTKLPHSGDAALSMPFCEPTGYGLGQRGWVSARFKKGEKPPVELLLSWIDESYRTVAPKKLVKELDARG